MNLLVIGNSEKSEHIIRYLDFTRPFLVIDDGPLIEALAKPLLEATTVPNRRKVVRLDFSHDRFNPLERMTYLKARAFATTVYAASPQGANTLTVRNGRRALVRLLLSGQARLDRIPKPKKKDAAIDEAFAAIDEILVSPVLKRIFCGRPTVPRKASLIAKIDRAELGDFDAFILANFLIGQFDGQVVVPDGGFYLRDHHTLLVRQDRLICGVHYFSELEERLRKSLIANAEPGGQCTWEDAQTLADYAGLSPGTNAYKEFVEAAVN